MMGGMFDDECMWLKLRKHGLIIGSESDDGYRFGGNGRSTLKTGSKVHVNLAFS